MGRCSECGRTRFHVYIRCERPVTDRRPRANQLRQRDRGQTFRMRQCNRPRNRDRCHRPHQCKGRHDRQLPMTRKVNQPLRHRNIKTSRAVGVDDRITIGIIQKLVIFKTTRDFQHLEIIKRLRRPTREHKRKLICVCHLNVSGEIMTQMDRDILGLYRWAHHLKDVKVMRYVGKLLKVTP